MNTEGRIVRNYLYNFLYQFVVLVTPIITAPYLARVLGSEQLGIYSYVFSFSTVITTISLLGIYSYGNRQMAYLRDERRIMSKEFCEIMGLRYMLALLGVTVYLIIAILDREYMVAFLCFMPNAVATLIDCSWIYVGVEDMKPTAMKNLIAKLASVGLIFILVKDEKDIYLYLLIIGVTTLITNIAVYFQLGKYIDYVRPNIRNLKKHFIGSVTLFLPEVASLFYLQVDKVMLKFLTDGTQHVSFYDQAEKIVFIPLTFITVISTTVMPRLANEYKKSNHQEIERLLNYSGIVSLLLAFPMMFGISAISGNFVEWYLGSEFSMSAQVIVILSPIIISNSLIGISATQYFTATNQIKIITQSYAIASLANIVVNAVLIPKMGCCGAAVATVISSYLSLIIQYLRFGKQVNIKPILYAVVKYAGFGLLMFVGISYLSGVTSNKILETCIQVLVGIILYVIVLFIFKDKCLKDGIKLIKEKLSKRKAA